MIEGLNIHFHVNFKVLKQIEKTFDGRLLFVNIYIYIDVQIFIGNFQKNKRKKIIVLLKLSYFDKQINVTKYDCIIPMCNNLTT
jgi:hypothetical protein